VVLNSAAALMVAGKAKDLEAGRRDGRRLVDGGKAEEGARNLVRICA
jgi:anthranilate phosphoribosyltransferase